MLSGKRPPSGHTTIELAAMALMIVIMTLFVLDAAVVVFAQNLLDEACRDAARCAAQAPDNVTAGTAASSALARHMAPDGGTPWVQGLKLLNVDYQPIAHDPSISLPNGGGGAAGGTMPGVPFVSVTAEITAHMPAVLNAFGLKLGESALLFKDTTTYPIINDPVPGAFNNFDSAQPMSGPSIPNNHLPCANQAKPAPVTPTACPGGGASPSTSGAPSGGTSSVDPAGTSTAGSGSGQGGSSPLIPSVADTSTGSANPGGNGSTPGGAAAQESLGLDEEPDADDVPPTAGQNAAGAESGGGAVAPGGHPG